MKKLALLVFLNICVGNFAKAQNYKVFAIRFAESGYPFTVGDWVDGGPKDLPLKIDFSLWLIRGNGKTILVDAGFLRDIEDAKDFKLLSYVRPDSALLKVGVKATAVTDIILSHPHWDHIDGLNLFPKAKIWIQKADYKYFTETAWLKGGENGGFAKRDVAMLIKRYNAGQVHLIEGDNKEIISGIRVFTGSKHTYDSQYVVVKTPVNNVVIASDNVWTYYSLEHLLPAAPGGTLDPNAYLESLKRMKALASDVKFIVPGHDADVYTHFKEIQRGVVEIK